MGRTTLEREPGSDPGISREHHSRERAANGRDVQRTIDALPAMIGYWDADLHNVLANRAYLDFFGVKPEALRGRTMLDLLGPELFARNRPYIERVLEGEPQLFARTIVDPTGTPRYTQTSYIPDVVDGEVVGFTALDTDITERRVAEKARARAEARFKLAFSASPLGMALIDEDGRLTEINSALSTMLGYSEDELCGRSLGELVDPAHHKEREQIANLFAGDPAPTADPLELLRKDGTSFWVLLGLAVANGDGDEAMGIGYVQDVTDRKRAVDEVRLGRARLNEAEQIAQMGSWELDIREGLVTWSEGLFHLFGLIPDEFDPTLEGGAQRVFPDDRELVIKTIERTIAERSSFSIEYRTLRADGRLRTLRSRGEVVVDEDGEPVRLVGIARDITDARLAQEALRNTSDDLERRAIELQKLAIRSAPERRVELHAPLTPRQLEILRLIAQGKTSATIADELVVTTGTIKWHVKQILAKTGSSSRAEAVARVLGSEL